MIPALLRDALTSYRRKLEEAFPGRVRSVVLFGSWARGEAHEDSDVDVLVLLDDTATFADRGRAIELGALSGFEHDCSWVIAPLVLTQSSWDELKRRERLLPKEIERDGVPA